MPLSNAGWRGSCLIAILLLSPAFGRAQSSQPITKEGLFEALRLCAPSAGELVRGIQANGVDFRLTAEDEQALAQLKTDPAALEAIRANYHGSAPQMPLPDGPPLTAAEVVTLLGTRLDPAWIASLVRKRGVEFAMTPQVGRSIVSAGGSNELVGAMVLSYAEPAPSAGSVSAAPQVAPVQLTREELARKVRHREKPEYPLQARSLAMSGSVVLQVQIDRSGELRAFGKSSGNLILVDAAKNAVRRWQWEPTLIDRTPVEVTGEVVVDFVR